MTVRVFFASLLVTLGAAQAEDPKAKAPDLDKELSRIVDGRDHGDKVAGAAVAVMLGDRLVYAGAAGCAEFDAKRPRKCLRPLKPTSKLRVASISKMALAMGLATLVDDGQVDLDRDASDYLGWRLLNPNFPDRPITARRLLSHTSSIRDPEEYWVAAPGRLQDLVAGDDGIFATSDGDAAAGADWFKYANINYGLLAGVIEGASHQRFDLFMTERVFSPAGLDIGFNWSGVSAAARKEGAALPRRDGKGWVAVVDGPAVLTDDQPYFLAAEGLDRMDYLRHYAPGENPTLFSPQGGLRASPVDLAALVRSLTDFPVMTTPVWRYDPAAPNGDPEGGLYDAYGLGVQFVRGAGDLFPGETLLGHAGDAYGLYSGAWLLKADAGNGRKEDLSIAYVVIGAGDSPAKGANPAFHAVEERLLRLAQKAAPAVAASETSGPRPFDESANAMQDVDAALLSARASGKMPLLILGGNWCHDSRGLAAKFEVEPLKSLIETRYQTVWIDVGHRDRNLEVAKRFGVDQVIGTPTVIILSSDGDVLNADSVHDWRTADSKPFDEALAYFTTFVSQTHE